MRRRNWSIVEDIDCEFEPPPVPRPPPTVRHRWKSFEDYGAVYLQGLVAAAAADGGIQRAVGGSGWIYFVPTSLELKKGAILIYIFYIEQQISEGANL